jgi:hypothetical protein
MFFRNHRWYWLGLLFGSRCYVTPKFLKFQFPAFAETFLPESP